MGNIEQNAKGPQQEPQRAAERIWRQPPLGCLTGVGTLGRAMPGKDVYYGGKHVGIAARRCCPRHQHTAPPKTRGGCFAHGDGPQAGQNVVVRVHRPQGEQTQQHSQQKCQNYGTWYAYAATSHGRKEKQQHHVTSCGRNRMRRCYSYMAAKTQKKRSMS